MSQSENNFRKILLIQTAFIGDVILSTALVENLSLLYPHAEISFLLRKGNESLLRNNPHVTSIISWNKKENKIWHLFQIIKRIRREHFDLVINLHRFASSGIITILSGAKYTRGFNKNPLSFLFSESIPHKSGLRNDKNFLHEVDRNNLFLKHQPLSDLHRRPALYPSPEDEEYVSKYKGLLYVTISPSSVWFTKQFPTEKWLELIRKLNSSIKIYILGGEEDFQIGEQIILQLEKKHNVENLAGKLSFLQSAALMRDAKMNFTNDSAPLHISSSMNAPTTAIFCSTIPEFGFGPLSDKYRIIEITDLECRPCGIHGYMHCPRGHFDCAYKIELPEELI